MITEPSNSALVKDNTSNGIMSKRIGGQSIDFYSKKRPIVS
jgi:hypothetical protein